MPFHTEPAPAFSPSLPGHLENEVLTAPSRPGDMPASEPREHEPAELLRHILERNDSMAQRLVAGANLPQDALSFFHDPLISGVAVAVKPQVQAEIDVALGHRPTAALALTEAYLNLDMATFTELHDRLDQDLLAQSHTIRYRRVPCPELGTDILVETEVFL